MDTEKVVDGVDECVSDEDAEGVTDCVPQPDAVTELDTVALLLTVEHTVTDDVGDGDGDDDPQ